MKKFSIILTGLILFGFFSFALRKDHSISTLEARQKFETEHSNYFEFRGSKIHYTDQGEGQIVMMFHGFAGSFNNWRRLIEAFPSGYRLVAVDLAGFGLSDPPQLAEGDLLSEYYSDMSHELISHLGNEPVYLIGNSMGGYLAWETAVNYPEDISKLVLLDAAGYDFENTGAMLYNFSRSKIADMILKKGIPKYITNAAGKRCLGNNHLVDHDHSDAFYELVNRTETLHTITMLGKANQFPDSSRIPNIEIPTLIVWGDKDKVVPIEHAHKFHRDIVNRELIIYEGSGHVPMIENTDQLISDLAIFFKEESL